MPLIDLLDLLSRGGSVATLALGLWLFFREDIVSGRSYRRVVRERDELQRELFETLSVADRATQIAAREVARRRALYGSSARLDAEREVQTGRCESLDDA